MVCTTSRRFTSIEGLLEEGLLEEGSQEGSLYMVHKKVHKKIHKKVD